MLLTPLPHLPEKESWNQRHFYSKNSQLPQAELPFPIEMEAKDGPKEQEMLPKAALAPKSLWWKQR